MSVQEHAWASTFHCDTHGQAVVEMVTTKKTCLWCETEGRGQALLTRDKWESLDLAGINKLRLHHGLLPAGVGGGEPTGASAFNMDGPGIVSAGGGEPTGETGE